ncbi:MAG: transcription termination factor Rho [Bifidobacteriaceae bacterium]|jgi:transcription termination factor Rho|nr:transcription termination factor Rho [Bifidobacteriaceae bacterium]
MSINDKTSLNSLKIAELRNLASDLKIKDFAKLKKAEIINAIYQVEQLNNNNSKNANQTDTKTAKAEQSSKGSQNSEIKQNSGKNQSSEKDQDSNKNNNSAKNNFNNEQPIRLHQRRIRQRKHKNNQDKSDFQINETDLQLSLDEFSEVEGLLDITEGYAFLRVNGYLPSDNDIYVSLGFIRRNNLRQGDYIKGIAKNPKNRNKQKYRALTEATTVNNMTIDEAAKRPDFNKLTPLYPFDRLRLETNEKSTMTQRIIDIVAPIGKGQRGLIVSPPKAGKTIILQQIANSIAINNPKTHLMVLLVDERPEEVTDMERNVRGEVISSTFDRPASDHTIVAELAVERAKRLVELGKDVVILLDSITRLGRAYNLAAPPSGRILSGGVDVAALYPPKKFFGAARNIEEGGSLTIIATALVETGSKMDEVIFEEFKGTGNMELKLSRELSNRRIFPAIDINASGTRREEVLIHPQELQIIFKLRKLLGGMPEEQAISLSIGKLRKTKTNAEFLMDVAKSTPESNDPNILID